MQGRAVRRLLAGLVFFAALLALAACGGGGGSEGGGAGATTADTGSRTVAVKDWVGAVCTSVGTWQKTLQEAPDLSNPTDLEATKGAISDFLGKVVGATDTLVADVRAAGVPDTPDGEAIATAMTDTLASVNTAFQKAKSDVDGLSTSDAATFAAGLQQVGEDLTQAGTKVGTAFEDLAKKYPSADLSQAAQDVPACSAITAG